MFVSVCFQMRFMSVRHECRSVVFTWTARVPHERHACRWNLCWKLKKKKKHEFNQKIIMKMHQIEDQLPLSNFNWIGLRLLTFISMSVCSTSCAQTIKNLKKMISFKWPLSVLPDTNQFPWQIFTIDKLGTFARSKINLWFDLYMTTRFVSWDVGKKKKNKRQKGRVKEIFTDGKVCAKHE